MAELNVQPKKKAPVWPWILLILIIAAVAYFLFRGREIPDGASANDDDTTESVNQYRTDTMSP
jgi:hypothetical protein